MTPETKTEEKIAQTPHRSWRDDLPEWMRNPTPPKRPEGPTIAQQRATEGHVSGHNKRDGSPFIARPWPRKLRPELETGDPGTNLLDDVADMLAKPELLTDSDQRATTRMHADGSVSAYLADMAFWKLTGLVRRYTVPGLAARFLRKQARDAQLASAGLASNAVLSPEARAARRERRAAQGSGRTSRGHAGRGSRI